MRTRLIHVGMCTALMAATVACRQDMQDQPKFVPLRGSAFFVDGRSARPLVEGTIARGQLRADTVFLGDDLRHHDPKFQAPRYTQYLAAVDALDRLAQERFGKRVIHLALRWALDQPGVGVALWGARRPDQLAPVADVMGWRIDADTMREIDAILARTIKDPVGPEFMAPPVARDV